VWLWAQSFAPVRLSVAVPARDDSGTAEVMRRFADLASNERAQVRFDLVETADLDQGAARLERRSVDLALVRLDRPLPRNASAVALLEGWIVLGLVAPAASATDVGQLRGVVGVIGASPQDRTLVQNILDAYRAQARAAPFETIEEASREVQARRVDAVFVVARRNDEAVARVVAALTGSGQRAPKPLALDEAVVRSRVPLVEAATVAKHQLVSARQFPAEEVTTVGLRHALLASNAVPAAAVAQATRFLFATRDRAAGAYPVLASLVPPPTDRGAALPVHAGTVDYIDNGEQSFLTRYGDWIYMGLWFSGALGSALVWLRTRYSYAARVGVAHAVEGLAEIAERAEQAATLRELAEVEGDLGRAVLDLARQPQYAADERALALVEFTYTAARAVVDARKLALAPTGPGARAAEPVEPMLRSRAG
jgi:hypothetical protein